MSECLTPVKAKASPDHLVPDAAHVVAATKYLEKLRETFKSGYSEGAILQALVIPSFGAEFVVGLSLGGAEYKVFAMLPKYPVYMFERAELLASGAAGRLPYVPPKNLPPSYLDNSLESHTNNVSDEFAKDVCKVWAEALLEVRRGEPGDPSLDGVEYTYSMSLNGYGVITGSSDGGERGDKMYDLSQIVWSLQKYAKADMSFADLQRKIDAYKAGRSYSKEVTQFCDRKII